MASQGTRAAPVASREESEESVEDLVAPASAGGVEVGREGVGADGPFLPVVLQWQDYHQTQAQLLAQAHASTPVRALVVPTIDRTLDPEVAERGEKVEDVMNLVNFTPENRLKVDDKYRPKMYRDKKRMELLNLVQGDDQTVVEYELRFAALAKYAPEAIAKQEDRCYRFEQGLRPRSKEASHGSDGRSNNGGQEEGGREGQINICNKGIEGTGDPRALTEVHSNAVHLLRLLLDQEGELDQVMVEDQFFLRVVLPVEDNIKGHVGDGMIYRRLVIVVEAWLKVLLAGLRAKVVLGVVIEELAEAEAEATEIVATLFIVARIYNITIEEAPASNDVISGTILLYDIAAYVLIDPGSTHSYISSEFASKIPGENSPLGSI
ncbi:UNVERIFIED_CONTAM: hypothetical protein Sindi_0714000 [Sesamum indicum]